MLTCDVCGRAEHPDHAKVFRRGDVPTRTCRRCRLPKDEHVRRLWDECQIAELEVLNEAPGAIGRLRQARILFELALQARRQPRGSIARHA